MQKIALGTVQFGKNYGIANHRGQIPKAEVKEILDTALQAGINTLDTASGYGESEQILGDLGIKSWNVVTKLPSFLNQIDDIELTINKQMSSSLTKLGRSQVEAVLLHNPLDLLDGARGNQIKLAFQNLKNNGLVGKIGVSVYSPEELNLIFEIFVPDLVQLPFNVIDRRFKNSGWLKRLKEQNIEVHARSIFLQGLLLINSGERPKYFDKWNYIWDQWYNWLNNKSISPLEGCLQFALSESLIDRVIVGVDSLAHLQQILDFANQGELEIPDQISCHDPILVNPSKWLRN